ncbi:MAG: hypothetical protein AMK73_04085, partial [Planctomycetes bacterium SM23_32]
MHVISELRGPELAQNKVMIIGLDAATLDLVRAWAEEGRLPNLARFLREGAWGLLQSTLPVMSPAAWSTFATGLNPGKHGILNFYHFYPDRYEPRYVNASHRRGSTFWEVAGQQDVRGGIINVPVTYPARPYSGFLVAGMLSPSLGPRMVHPPELLADLLAVSPDYMIDVDVVSGGNLDPERFYRLTVRCLEARLEAALGLYRMHRPPLFCVVFTAADRVSHYFWPYHEALMQGRARTEAELTLGQALRSVYEKLDEAVGQLMSEAGDDTDVVILSDHGAGPLRKGLNLRELLIQEGLLAEVPRGAVR